MQRVMLLKIIAKFFIVGVMLFGQPAQGVTSSSVGKGSLHTAATTLAASRAQSDLQIRRLKTLFATELLDPEAYFQQIRSLQRETKESKVK